MQLLEGYHLRIAATEGNLLKVERLVRAKEQQNDIQLLKRFCNSKNPFGWTALHRAAENGHLEIVEYLVALPNGAVNIDTECTMPRYRTALHVACAKGYVDIARVLLQAGANVNKQEDFFYTPLHLAARYGHTELAQLLLEHGAHRSMTTNLPQNQIPGYASTFGRRLSGQPPSNVAMIWGHKETAQVINNFS